jgi:hypothetical protein
MSTNYIVDNIQIPPSSLTPDNFTANPAETPKASESFTPPPPPEIDFAKLPKGTYIGYIHTSNVQYFVARLLGNAISLLDATIPNKDQNKAVKHLLRKEFDRAILDVHKMAWPLTEGDVESMKAQQSVTSIVDGYILQPER